MLYYRLPILGNGKLRDHTDLDRKTKRVEPNVLYSLAQSEK